MNTIKNATLLITGGTGSFGNAVLEKFLNKSIIIIHNEDHQHALKEVDAAASAVASDQEQAVRILKYVLSGSLDR